MTNPEDGSSNRREFLKFAGTAAPLAAVAVTSTGGVADASPVDPASEKMQDTEHTRKYFASARF